MKISIVIPVKDEAIKLRDCLRAIANQNTENIEQVLVVENGSCEIQDDDFKDFKIPIKLIRLPKPNRSQARNVGAQNVFSEIIAFIDADVEIEDQWVDKTIIQMSKGYLAIQGKIIPQAAKNNLLQKLRLERAFSRTGGTFLSLFQLSQNKVVLNTAACAVSRKAFVAIGGFDPLLNRYEDLDFTQRLLSLDGEIVAIRTIKSKVFFSGNFFDYFLREISCGVEIVRYHDKWKSGSVGLGFIRLMQNIRAWGKKIFKRNEAQKYYYLFWLLEGGFFFGNFMGLFNRLINPYPVHKKLDYCYRARVRIE